MDGSESGSYTRPVPATRVVRRRRRRCEARESAVTISESPVSAQTVADGLRSVTDEECAFYDEHGWALLPRFISEPAAEMLCREAERLMGVRATHTNIGTVSEN